MQYQTIAEAYRDLEQVTGRLALTDRLAELLAGTPAGLLPVVCYLCQGLIAPEFAGVDLGLFRAVTKCGAGFSDADLAALPARLAPLVDLYHGVRRESAQPS
jgi:hypothetical protein